MKEKIRDNKKGMGTCQKGTLFVKGVPFWHVPIIVLVMATCFLSTAYANNIKVTNCQLINMLPDAQSTTADIQFDISWENSWRYGTVLYDAAWVFAKYSVNDGAWQHATITGVTSVGASGTGLTIDVPTDNKGAFLYRSAADTGTLSTTAVKLQWNRTADGVAYNTTKVKIQVFAIEMVHIPQGSFYVGSGGTELGSFTDGSWTSGATIPLKITSENALTIGTSAGNLWGTSTSGSSTIGPTGTLPAAFPKGFQSFYIMKYELTQGQYRDFLNTLTRTQQQNRIGTTIISSTTSVTNVYVMSNTATVSARNGIACAATIPATTPITFYCDLNANGTGNESADGEWIACNYLSWMDLCAYADWADLRPITELEFEKACRGPKAVVANEFAWGPTNLTQATGISNAGTANEIASNSDANCGSNSTGLIFRVGFTATSSSSSRAQSGVSFYGVPDLSANVWERIVSIGNTQGRTFTGSNGNGVLSANGYATNSDWPGYNSGEVTGCTGSGVRGGYTSGDTNDYCVSNRHYGFVEDGRDWARGGHLVRTQ